jgi:predicted amidohydrolase YtcJ
VFDGVAMHEGWSVLVEGDRITGAGPNLTAPAGAKVIALPGATLMPGMIEGHSHLLLHPYNETLWDDQVLHEPLALRTARGAYGPKGYEPGVPIPQGAQEVAGVDETIRAVRDQIAGVVSGRYPGVELGL